MSPEPNAPIEDDVEGRMNRVTVRATGGARVTRRVRNRPSGNNSRMRRVETPRTSGLRGLLNVKLYHNTPPPGRTHCHILFARRRRNPSSSSDEKHSGLKHDVLRRMPVPRRRPHRRRRRKRSLTMLAPRSSPTRRLSAAARCPADSQAGNQSAGTPAGSRRCRSPPPGAAPWSHRASRGCTRSLAIARWRSCTQSSSDAFNRL